MPSQPPSAMALVELGREFVRLVFFHPVVVVEFPRQLGDRPADQFLVIGQLEVHSTAGHWSAPRLSGASRHKSTRLRRRLRSLLRLLAGMRRSVLVAGQVFRVSREIRERRARLGCPCGGCAPGWTRRAPRRPCAARRRWPARAVMWANGSNEYQRMAFSWVILLISSSGTLLIDEHVPQLLGRARPHRVAVRVVGLPADVVDADHVAQRDADRVADEAGEEVLAEHLARQLAAEVLLRPGGCIS